VLRDKLEEASNKIEAGINYRNY